MGDGGRMAKYDDLPTADGVGGRHAWDVFGAGDELGRVNLMTSSVVLDAVSTVRRGKVFDLTLPLTLPDPPWAGGREPFRHHIFAPTRNSQDDYLDNFYLQQSTQWDGLRHIRARELGYYGGVQAEAASGPDGKLGIEKWVEHGIVSRGVLVDVAGARAAAGEPLDPRVGTPITVEDLRATLAVQGLELRSGDVLMLRTGYLDAYLEADESQRADFTRHRDNPGLHAGEEMAEFLWDSGVAAVVADNPAVEVSPGSPEAGFLHRRLIPLLGFALGEFFRLGDLARDCEEDGNYACLFVGVPLNLPGGVGSPGNAVAIK